MKTSALAAFLFIFPAAFLSPLGAVSERDRTEAAEKAKRDAPWLERAIIYQVSLRSLSPEGKLILLEDKLQGIKDFGFSAVLLDPVFPVGEENRKGTLGDLRAVKDFNNVGLEFGTKDALKKITGESHASEIGLKFLLSWVGATTSRDHAWVKSKPEYYLKDSSGALLVKDGRTDLAWLDYSNENLRKAMMEALTSWAMDYDIDGFRVMDADESSVEFWQVARKELKKIKPNFVLISASTGPAIAQAFEGIPARDSYFALRDIVAGKADASVLEQALKIERSLPPFRFSIRTAEEDGQPRAAEAFGPASQAAAFLSATLPGILIVANGQEMGETLAQSPTERAPVRWKENKKNQPEVRKFYKKLIEERRGHTSFIRGQYFRIPTSDDKKILAYALSYRGDAALCAVNLSSSPFKGSLDLPEIFRSDTGAPKVKALFPGASPKPEGSGLALDLPAWGFQMWEAK